MRLDASLVLTLPPNEVLGRASLEGSALVCRHRRRETGRIEGPAERLALLAELVPGRQLPAVARSSRVLLPQDLEAFEGRARAEADATKELLDEGRALVEAVERLVCALYGLPAELEEAVLAHAASRAAGASGSKGE